MILYKLKSLSVIPSPFHLGYGDAEEAESTVLRIYHQQARYGSPHKAL